MKKVGIIQSNYLPWKGYFDLIKFVNELILYDDVQYTKNDWRNRNIIKTHQGNKWITIPVSKQHLSQKMYETKVANSLWQKKHWKTICQSYSKSHFFNETRDIFEELYLNTNEEYLSQINYNFIRTINSFLGINTKISLSSHFTLHGKKTERLVGLCKQTRAEEYISGPSAKDYLDEGLFNEENIKVSWMDYSKYPEYNQLFPPFTHQVSIIDLIFNEGPNAPKFMKGFCNKF